MNLTAPTSGRSSARRPCDSLERLDREANCEHFCLGQDWGSGGRSRRRFQPYARSDIACQQKYRRELQKLCNAESHPSTNTLPIYRPDFPIPIPATAGEDAVLLPGNPSTLLILVESSSGLKIGAEHVRSVQTYAAARRTDGYWT